MELTTMVSEGTETQWKIVSSPLTIHPSWLHCWVLVWSGYFNLLFSFCQFGNPIASHLREIFWRKKHLLWGNKKKGGFCPKATWSQLGEG